MYLTKTSIDDTNPWKNMKLKFFKPAEGEKYSIPLVSAKVQAGFPSQADHAIEKRLDLNELLISHPAATFFVRVEGCSMIDANIFNEDILIVDRALEPRNKAICVAIIDGEFTVKRLLIKKKQIYLMPENPDYPPIHVDELSDFQIWGVVTYIIHKT